MDYHFLLEDIVQRILLVTNNPQHLHSPLNIQSDIVWGIQCLNKTNFVLINALKTNLLIPEYF